MRQEHQMLSGRTIRVLSIDGGGIRGIVPALILQRLEEELEKRGQTKPLARLFHLIAGTSTGGILALSLATPDEQGRAKYKAADLVNLYRNEGKLIFPNDGVNKLRTLSQAFREKYKPQVLEKVAKDYLGDTKLDETLVPVLVTAFNATQMQIELFRSSKARKSQDQNWLLRDVLRATTAAPTYFGPAQISSLGGNPLPSIMVDGGLFANNPALLAFQEARKVYPLARRFEIVSLGTGRELRAHSYDTMKRWGFVDWINPLRSVPLFAMSQEAQNQSVSYTLKHAKGVHYTRFEAPLEGCSTHLDDASDENLQCLEVFAGTLIDRNREQFAALVRRLERV